MIHTSKLRTIRVLFAAALAVAGCSGTSGGQIPCVDDVSCPNDYPVCGPAGKCIAGTSVPPNPPERPFQVLPTSK